MYFRNAFYIMIWYIVRAGMSSEEIQPLLAFMDKCKDGVMLAEVTQLLLCLIAERGTPFALHIATVCNGSEGFASFVLFRLITNPTEIVRSLGIRLLTHFYVHYAYAMQRSSYLSSSPKTVFLNVVSNDSSGLELFRQSGGFSLLQRIMSNYSSASGELTYNALMEMLFSNRMTSSFLGNNEFFENTSGDGAYSLSEKALLSKQFVFTLKPFTVSSEMFDDTEQATISVGMLPVLFDIVTELTTFNRMRILSDILDIVKYSSLNCDVFVAHSDWARFVVGYVLGAMERVKSNYLQDKDLVSYLICSSNHIDRGSILDPHEFSNIDPVTSVPLLGENAQMESSLDDELFPLVSKIVSTVVLRELENKSNSREIERLILLSSEGSANTLACRAILDILLYELKSMIRRKHRNLLKSAMTFGFSDRCARDLLENIVASIITIAQYVLGEISNREGVQLFGLTSKWTLLNSQHIDFITLYSKIPSEEHSMEELLYLLRRAAPIHESADNIAVCSVLERKVDLDLANVLLLEESLELFDAVFKEGDANGSMRAGHFLRFQKERKQPSENSSNQPILFEALLLSCIYIVRSLSPTESKAVTNVRRLQWLIKNVDPSTMKQQAVEQLLLNVVGECVYALMRIREALSILYTSLGYANLEVALAEMLGDEIDFDAVVNQDKNLTQQLYEDQRSLDILDVVFGSDHGRNFVDFVMELFKIICSVYERKNHLIKESLDDVLSHRMTAFTRRVQTDILLSRNGRLSSRHNSFRIFDVTPSSSGDATSVSEISHLSLRRDTLFNEPVDSRPTSLRIYNLGASFSKLNEAGQSGSVASGRASGHMSGCSSPNGSEHPGILDLSAVISVLSLMRDPFLLEPSAEALLENRYSVRSFIDVLGDDLRLLKATPSALAVRATMAIGKMPTWSNAAREKLVLQASTSKIAAFSWKCCLSRFEVPWSPWIHSKDSRRRVIYELAKHRDTLLRRNLLMKSLDVSDYSHYAHYGSKKSYQLLYKQDSDDKGSPMKRDSILVTASLKSSSLRRLLSKKGTSSWGESEFLFEAPSETLMGRKPQRQLGIEFTLDERELYTSEATLVELERSTTGIVYLTNKNLYFNPLKVIEKSIFNPKIPPLKTRRWVLECLTETHGRRHLLKNCGIELFFADSLEVFIAFRSLQELQKFFYSLRRLSLPKLSTPPSLHPRIVCSSMQWTDLWRARRISNFEYLTHLNTLAGRSYNDISQYPVFPWIIADYESEVLDLTNPASFRDLSRPIGAINSNKHQEIMDRYHNSFDEDDLPRFMYGGHYSSAGVVLHYLIRQEPFTAMAVTFQGGRFDCPDRLFFNIKRTWEGLSNSLADVKELIPEFFCCPELFMNTNNLPLGELQEGGEVSDVILPPWAKDAFDFVRLNREALESDYVSDNLHHWIDLIFGYKQVGDAAVEAKNVFSYLTYENAIDIEQIADQLEREATIAQVVNFGQTPSQLFESPHPRRMPKNDCGESVCLDLESLIGLEAYRTSLSAESCGGIICVRAHADKIAACYEDLTIVQGKWSETKSKRLPCSSLAINASINASRKSSTVIVDMSSTRIASCGYWDNSIRVHALDSLKEVASTTSGHNGAINCIQIDKLGSHTIFTGGVDATCRIWVLEHASIVSSFNDQKKDMLHSSNSVLICVHVLCGHHSPIVCLCYSPDADLMLSGSEDGSICLHTVKKGDFAHMVSDPIGTQIDLLFIAPQNFLISHAWSTLGLTLYSLNAHKLVECASTSKIECFATNPLSDILICGLANGNLLFYILSQLKPIKTFDIPDCYCVKSLCFAEGIVFSVILLISFF